MIDPKLTEIFKAKLSDKDFDRLSNFIYSEYGIKMPKIKHVMLQSRLQKRLRELSITSFKDYVDFVFSKDGQDSEVIHMIDVVSTNKTDFFREAVHFDFMMNNVLPEFIQNNPISKPIKIWSAGCASGEEPYTIAIVISEFKEKNHGPDYLILGTDISSRILKSAVEAIYKENRVENIPLDLKRKYFLKSKDRTNASVRLIPEIRKRTMFQRLNFMEQTYNINDMFDVIFCRNVLIYFDRTTQENVIKKLSTKLKSGGYFFLGHSESITGMKVPLEQIKPTILKKY